MTNEEIEVEVSKIDSKISNLQKERKLLEKKLFDQSTDFAAKFKIWYENSDIAHHKYITNEEKFPLLRQRIADWDYIEKHQTFDLERLFEEAMFCIIDPKDALKYASQEEIDEKIKEYQPDLEEVMNGNLKSFTYNW